jgi:hypothetical protein
MSVKKVFIGMLFEMGSIGKSTQNRKLKEKHLPWFTLDIPLCVSEPFT